MNRRFLERFNVKYVISETPLPWWTISSSSVKSTSVNIEWSQFPLSLHSAHQMALMVTEPNREMFVFVRVHNWQRSKHIGNLSPNRVYLFKVVVFTGINPNNVTYVSQNISLRTNPGGKLICSLARDCDFVNICYCVRLLRCYQRSEFKIRSSFDRVSSNCIPREHWWAFRIQTWCP